MGKWNGPEGNRNRSGRKPGAATVPMALRDMRAIYVGKVVKDSPGAQALQKMFDADPGEFLKQLRSAEHQHLATSRKSQEAAQAEPARDADPGTDECIRLIDEILAKAEADARGPAVTESVQLASGETWSATVDGAGCRVVDSQGRERFSGKDWVTTARHLAMALGAAVGKEAGGG